MNTSKQVNIMIGLLFLSVLFFGGLVLYEAPRQTEAREEHEDLLAERGATLFVNNCRNCHGMVGEGHIGPPLNIPGFRILEEGNAEGAPATPLGEVDSLTRFLTDTIACGRTGTFMPVWSQDHGGPLSEIQVDYLVAMITQGRWDLVEELGIEHDAATETTDAVLAEDILVQDASSLAATEGNCGQYSEELAAEFRGRDPFEEPGADGGATPEPTETSTPGGGGAPVEGGVAVSLTEFAVEVSPASTAAGEVAFNVANDGAVAHNFRAVRTDLAPDALPVAGGAVDESALEVVAETEDLQGGGSTGATGDLAAGSYVLFCNVSGHYTLGMFTGFTVE